MVKNKEYEEYTYEGETVKLYSPDDYLKHEPMDRKVIPLVVRLNEAGFVTRASCQGHKGYVDRAGTRSVGFVVFLQEGSMSRFDKAKILGIARSMGIKKPRMKVSETGLSVLEFEPI